MQPITLELPLPPKCLHPNAKPHWRARMQATRKARGESALVARMQRPATPFGKATAHAMFYLKNANDTHNLSGWIKAYIDGLQDGGVITNDRHLTLLPPEQVTNTPIGQRRVVLTITPTES